MKTKALVITLIAAGIFCGRISAQNADATKYVDAKGLTIIGKIMPTENVYHRVDTVYYKGFNQTENFQVRCGSGLAVLFKTNSTSIKVLAEYGEARRSTVTSDLAQLGFDLYMKKDGRWMFAASGVRATLNDGSPINMISDMDGREKECMLYLPMYSEILKLDIGIDSGAEISPMPSPFRHRIALYGSSYTQGACISRAGMSYPMQFVRNTGIQLLSLGCGGSCKMQDQFTRVLRDCEVDAMVFDCFSNPNADLIHKRTKDFVRKIRETHPGTPLVFISSVYRENRNFSLKNEAYERAKMEAAREEMAEITKADKNVYFIDIKELTGNDHETSVDGVHPSDLGYQRWAKAIEKPLLKILRKYGIK